MNLPEEWTWKKGPGGLGALWKGKTLTSSYSPRQDALRKAQHLPEAALYVVLGWGTGHLARSLAEIHDDSLVLAMEPHPGRAFAAREHPEWTEAVERVFFLQETEVPYGLLSGFPYHSIHILFHPALEEEPDLTALKNAISIYLDRQAVNFRTLKRFAGLWGRNLRYNLECDRLESANAWKGSMNGSSLMIAAAGPSLDAALQQLKGIEPSSYTLLAVDSALPALRARALVPDAVVSMDAQYWNSRHVDSLDGETLVVELVSHPSVIRRHRGRVVVTGSSIPPVADLEAQRFPHLPSGGSVATAAASFAALLGVSHTLWLGLDLSWVGGRTHASPALAETLIQASAHRLEPPETKNLGASLSQPRVPITTLEGKTILVDQRHHLYALWLDEAQANRLIPNGHRLFAQTTIPRFLPEDSAAAFLQKHPSRKICPPKIEPWQAPLQEYADIRRAWYAWRQDPSTAYPQKLSQTWNEWLGPTYTSLQRFRFRSLEKEWAERCAIIDDFFSDNTRR